MGAPFATTQWSQVLAARDPADTESQRALASLCEAYWYSLYAYVRSQGHDPDESRDLTSSDIASIPISCAKERLPILFLRFLAVRRGVSRRRTARSNISAGTPPGTIDISGGFRWEYRTVSQPYFGAVTALEVGDRHV